ncbi:MAG TPA: plastocyanin/azurin family copper-binding protein [Actinomycetota bacterium]|nr:plastocyanin/azurin family copper-binding protein [Actinomycetota bacterium]
MRRRALAALVAVLLAACTGGGAGDGAPSEVPGEPVPTTRVTLPKSYRFEPAAIVVEAGATVTWVNRDDFPHNVHLLDGSDRTVPLPVGGRGSLTFEEPGTYYYECSIHPQQMHGVVTVRG